MEVIGGPITLLILGIAILYAMVTLMRYLDEKDKDEEYKRLHTVDGKELVPLGDNVLLIHYTQKQDESTGMILPEELQRSQFKTTCVVSALGPDVKSNLLREGTFVIIPKRTGMWVKFEGGEYILVKEDDILAVIAGAYVTVEDIDIETKEDDYNDRTI